MAYSLFTTAVDPSISSIWVEELVNVAKILFRKIKFWYWTKSLLLRTPNSFGPIKVAHGNVFWWLRNTNSL